MGNRARARPRGRGRGRRRRSWPACGRSSSRRPASSRSLSCASLLLCACWLRFGGRLEPRRAESVRVVGVAAQGNMVTQQKCYYLLQKLMMHPESHELFSSFDSDGDGAHPAQDIHPDRHGLSQRLSALAASAAVTPFSGCCVCPSANGARCLVHVCFSPGVPHLTFPHALQARSRRRSFSRA